VGRSAVGSNERKGNKALEDSRINRDGLTAGTPAPNFRLPAVGARELSLNDCRGRRLLLVFSDPDCGPCSQLLPELERLYRRSQDLQILMVSRGDAESNNAKISEYGLTFPVAIQRKWEIPKKYGIFATPVGYLIDEQGIVEADVAIGGGAILALAMAEEGSGITH
jgi:peroxiredoxin